MEFFDNPDRVRCDPTILHQRFLGNQYNLYINGVSQYSPPHPHDARNRNQNRNRDHRRRNHNHNHNIYGQGARNVDVSNETFTFVGGQVINYPQPPRPSAPVNNKPRRQQQHVQNVVHVEPGVGEDIEMTGTAVDSEPHSNSSGATPPDRLPPFAHAYVVFRLDIQSTVNSPQLQQNPSLIAAVRNMPIKYFVGYVDPIGDDTSEFRIHLLRHGPPPNSPLEHITPQMGVSVYPNNLTAVDPESSREPLRLEQGKELPWADSYHSSADHLAVRILVDAGGSDPPNEKADMTRLPFSEVVRHSSYLAKDYKYRSVKAHRRMDELAIAKRELQQLMSGTGSSSRTLDDAALEQAQLNVARLRESSMALKRSLAAQMNAQETVIMTVQISHDLSLVNELPDPKELLDQQKYLADMLKKVNQASRGETKAF